MAASVPSTRCYQSLAELQSVAGAEDTGALLLPLRNPTFQAVV